MSMANGIEFYKKKNIEGFKDSEETIKFTKLLNNMFDALNRKFPAEGIRKNSQDLQVFYLLCCVIFVFHVIHVCLIYLLFAIHVAKKY